MEPSLVRESDNFGGKCSNSLVVSHVSRIPQKRLTNKTRAVCDVVKTCSVSPLLLPQALKINQK